MWSFSNNSRTKLSRQPLSRAVSSLCPRSRQGLSTASLWHSSGHSRRPARFLLPAMIPRGSLPQGCWCIARLSLLHHRLGPQRLPAQAVSQGMPAAQGPVADKPWLFSSQPAVALHHFCHTAPFFLGNPSASPQFCILDFISFAFIPSRFRNSKALQCCCTKEFQKA